MRPLLACLLLLLSAPALGQIYRSVAPDGSVIYSDQPTPGAEAVELGPLPTLPPPRIPRAAEPAASKPPYRGYVELVIASPEPEAVLRDNQGNVAVTLELYPPLRPGHRYRVLVDGKPGGTSATAATLTLANVDRGSHVLEAIVLDAEDRELIRSAPVQIHLLRATVR